ncbi:nucleoside hydrolase [Salinicoccus albus]|uniref:nucleoside hydrolase n=1 Tax=Salinicoccus albus TaxID=418756 RepID=UPI0003710B91|nr:nucleoside hydrolase [Salinicoccus albus]
MARRKVILDCDPGHDDAVSIIIAASQKSDLDILGITTTAGNVEVEKTTCNALKISTLLDIDAPIFQGAKRPMVKAAEIAPEIHGETGMDGPKLPEPKITAEEKHAVDFIVDTLKQADGKVTLVPTGPLTNIAMALIKAPEVKGKIDEIVLMGGGTFGNWTPAAEFNIYVDAEAAKVVFDSNLPITMFGLDVTHQVIATKGLRERFSAIDNKISHFVVELLEFFGKTNEELFGFDGGPIHDACTTMYLIQPELFNFKHVNVEIETKGEYTYGMTAVDLYNVTGRIPHVKFADSVDQEAFWQLFGEILSSYSR